MLCVKLGLHVISRPNRTESTWTLVRGLLCFTLFGAHGEAAGLDACFFHQFRLSTESWYHHFRLGSHHTTVFLRRERWTFNNCGVIFTLTLIHWLGPPNFHSGDPNPRQQFEIRGMPKDRAKKTTPPSVGLEPTIRKLQISAFINWAILPPALHWLG